MRLIRFAGAIWAALLLAACSPPASPSTEVTVPVTVVVPVKETVVVTQEVTAAPPASFSTPHPVLGDVNVRRAIAYCTDREALIRSVYPFVAEPDTLRLDTFLPRSHWAYAAADPEVAQYEYDPDQGQALLEEAGWSLAEGAVYRTNATGEQLALTLTMTESQFRKTWAAVFEENMKDCGLRVLRFHVPFDWWQPGPPSGLAQRDFELGAFAWQSQIEPSSASLYSCSQIPRPENGWTGQNYAGWCNEAASAAVEAANREVIRQARVDAYRIVQEAFTQDMFSLPLFYRAEAAAANIDLVNFLPNTTEDYLWNVHEWGLPEADTATVGIVENPETLFPLVERTRVGRLLARLIYDRPVTSLDYDYQAVLLTQLPTIEAGLALNNDVEVREGDPIWDANGEAAVLEAGTLIVDAQGQVTEFTGGSARMKQLVVTYQWQPNLRYSDGERLKAADFELAYRIDCDPNSGAVLPACDKIQSVDFVDDRTYVVTWKPGLQEPQYYLPPIGYYPAHRILADGRRLGAVPAQEWATLPEIAEDPIGLGPYQLSQWDKGQQLVFEANPFYWRGAEALALKTLVFQVSPGSAEAVAQLLAGRVDVLGPEAVGIGGELNEVLAAAEAGAIQAQLLPTTIWEHIDMNLFVR